MIERITQVFGPKKPGWDFVFQRDDIKVVDSGKRATVRLKYAEFHYFLFNESGDGSEFIIPTSGVNTNLVEYVEEGARASALGGALKSLCFQLPVYKGHQDHHNAGMKAAKKAEHTLAELVELAVSLDAADEAFAKKIIARVATDGNITMMLDGKRKPDLSRWDELVAGVTAALKA